MRPAVVVLAALLGCVAAGCQSGSSGPSCSFLDPATLAHSAWPKFRHDLQNTGTITDAAIFTAVSHNAGQKAATFPPLDEPAQGSFSASPVINNAGDRIYIGSTNGTLYKLMASDLRQDVDFGFSIVGPITSTALLGTRSSTADAVFVGGGDGFLYALDGAAAAQLDFWPFVVSGFVSASPTLNASDGTVLVGGFTGLFFGVCPNGVQRFAVSVGSIQSSAAVGPDGTAYFGADNRQLQAVAADGTFRWAFSASAPIQTAPVVDVENGMTAAIYITDTGGRMFKVDPIGQPVAGFRFLPVGPIFSSPALSANRLYVGSNDSKLYAIDKDNGARIWTFAASAAIVSSPAVVTDGTRTIVVVGSDDGNVYFVGDDGVAVVPPVPIGGAVRSSPAIASDGTVYVGAADGRVYAIK
jgi:outer membrane protein assembly factor BamB